MRRVNRLSRARRGVIGVLVVALAAGCSQFPSDEEPRGGPAPERTSSTSESVDTTKPTGGDSSSSSRGAHDVVVGKAVASGLQTPWDVDFLDDGSALVTLRDPAEVIRLDGDRTVTLDAGGTGGKVPGVQHESEDGLLGLAVGPDDGVYLYMTTDKDHRVVRYDLEGDSLVAPEVIVEGIPRYEQHAGGRLAFGPDGYLYVTTGDARNLDLPQDTSSLAGKILRVTTAGEPAPGNPFDNEVWSYGHRNVQGIGWTSDGMMYASEFGSSEFDELNRITKGGNYGWPHIEGWSGEDDYIDPLVTWSTSEASPSGIAVTDEGVWLSALMGERLWYVPLGPDGEVGEPRAHQLDLGRLRAVVIPPDGGLWVVTSNTDGRGDPAPSDDRIVRLRT